MTQVVCVSRQAMGSRFEIFLCGEDSQWLRTLGIAALNCVFEWESRLTPYREESELARMNRLAFAQTVPLSAPLFDLLTQWRHWSEITEGAFNPAAGKIARLRGFWRQGDLQGDAAGRPDARELMRIIENCSWRNVELDAENRAVRYLSPEIEIHPGAAGKGHIVQAAADYLRAEGVSSAFLHCGQSSIAAIGSPPDNPEGWPVGIPTQNTEKAAEVESVIFLRGAGLSVSRSDGQFVRAEGQPFGHLFDPRTGEALPPGLLSAVSAPHAGLADALTTAFCVQGRDWSRAFAERYAEVKIRILDTD